MTRSEAWPRFGLVLAMALAAVVPALAADSPTTGYDVLGDLAVMDQGRIKPLDTLAIAKVKSIYGRSTIKLRDEQGEVIATWEPVAALLDWSVRPDFWNEQDILLVEYLPLKRMLLAGPIREQLQAAANRATTSAADKEVLQSLIKLEDYHDSDVSRARALPTVGAPDKAALKTLLTRLSGDNKWLSPGLLERAEIAVQGQSIPFTDWFRSIQNKHQGMGGGDKKRDLDDKVSEVGFRLFTYQAIRDRNTQGFDRQDLLVLPRPHNAAYLAFAGDLEKRFSDGKTRETDLSPLELNVLNDLASFLKNLRPEERETPGAGNAKFDSGYTTWLQENAEWVPLRVVLKTDEAELVKAGFPADQVKAFRSTFQELVAAENEAPNRLPENRAQAFVVATRDLGASLGKYPTATVMARESHYNRFGPFYKAPMAYGLALVVLLLSLGVKSDLKTSVGKLGAAIYSVGVLGLITGIALEVYGFYLRVRISGWAPVTNMYETVIWVALIAAIIGLVFELLSRKTYPALGASGIAFLTTVLAANISLLDPSLGHLMPVLRSNYWLTIHVLTIVSSYAAFALTLGLGLLAIGFYLTATYRSTARFSELIALAGPGLPVLALGSLGVYGSYAGWATFLLSGPVFYFAALIAAMGGMMTIAGVYAAIGELANRKPAAVGALGTVVLLAGGAGATMGWLHLGPEQLRLYEIQFASWTVAIVGVSWLLLGLFGRLAQATLATARREVESADLRDEVLGDSVGSLAMGTVGGGGVATLTRPAAMARGGQGGKKGRDARSLAMQATAARIKPLSEFVYRVMQVGVLLVAAGTILGGVWADVSWGRFWGWDAKEVWALITLLVYLVPLHGRFAGWVSTFGLMAASVICFLSVLMAWYGVNFVLNTGLHSYGFTEGGGQGIVVSCSLAVLAVVGAAYWRRHLSSRAPVPEMEV